MVIFEDEGRTVIQSVWHEKIEGDLLLKPWTNIISRFVLSGGSIDEERSSLTIGWDDTGDLGAIVGYTEKMIEVFQGLGILD